MPLTRLSTRRLLLIGIPVKQSCQSLPSVVSRRTQQQERYSKYNGTPRPPNKAPALGLSRRGVPTPKPSASGKPDRPMRDVLLTFLAIAIAVPMTWYHFSRPSHDDSKIFDPPRFTHFTIVAREEVSPTSIVLTLRPASVLVDSDPYTSDWEKGTWSVEFKQPELQIARSYTPLPPIASTTPGDLRFLIRKEHKGEVSTYLHGLPVGGHVQLRGPHHEFNLPKDVTNVVFVAGGTGIAPALQVAHALLETRPVEEETPRIHIVWANRRRQECAGITKALPATKSFLWKVEDVPQKTAPSLVVQELEALQQKYPGHMSVEYLVDEEGTFVDQKRLTQLLKRDTEVRAQPRHERIDKRLLFVSGPEGFVSSLAGPKRWEGGKEGQGEIGGVIGKMRVHDWKVWKL